MRKKIEFPGVKIVTKKVKIAPKDSVQLMAVFIDSTGAETDTTITWSTGSNRIIKQ